MYQAQLPSATALLSGATLTDDSDQFYSSSDGEFDEVSEGVHDLYNDKKKKKKGKVKHNTPHKPPHHAPRHTSHPMPHPMQHPHPKPHPKPHTVPHKPPHPIPHATPTHTSHPTPHPTPRAAGHASHATPRTSHAVSNERKAKLASAIKKVAHAKRMTPNHPPIRTKDPPHPNVGTTKSRWAKARVALSATQLNHTAKPSLAASQTAAHLSAMVSTLPKQKWAKALDATHRQKSASQYATASNLLKRAKKEQTKTPSQPMHPNDALHSPQPSSAAKGRLGRLRSRLSFSRRANDAKFSNQARLNASPSKSLLHPINGLDNHQREMVRKSMVGVEKPKHDTSADGNVPHRVQDGVLKRNPVKEGLLQKPVPTEDLTAAIHQEAADRLQDTETQPKPSNRSLWSKLRDSKLAAMARSAHKRIAEEASNAAQHVADAAQQFRESRSGGPNPDNQRVMAFNSSEAPPVVDERDVHEHIDNMATHLKQLSLQNDENAGATTQSHMAIVRQSMQRMSTDPVDVASSEQADSSDVFTTRQPDDPRPIEVQSRDGRRVHVRNDTGASTAHDSPVPATHPSCAVKTTDVERAIENLAGTPHSAVPVLDSNSKSVSAMSFPDNIGLLYDIVDVQPHQQDHVEAIVDDNPGLEFGWVVDGVFSHGPAATIYYDDNKALLPGLGVHVLHLFGDCSKDQITAFGFGPELLQPDLESSVDKAHVAEPTIVLPEDKLVEHALKIDNLHARRMIMMGLHKLIETHDPEFQVAL